MIAKINPNRTFAVLADYTNNKEKDARIIAHKDVCIVNNQAITDSFETQASTNKRVKNPCKHISLSFSPHDANRMTDDFMAQIAKEYMEKMGIRNTQYIVVRHNDKQHPHCHIVYNRVSNDGKTISDSRNFQRSRKIAYDLTVKHGLYMANKEQDQEVKRHRLKGKDKTRYRMKDKIREARSASKNWQQFNTELKKRGICMNIFYHKRSHLIHGVSFTEGIRHLTGVKLNASYPMLCKDFGDLAEDIAYNATLTAFVATASAAEGVAKVISIGLDTLLELALPSQQQSISSGIGGGSNNDRNWNDDDKKRKKNENYKPYKFRR